MPGWEPLLHCLLRYLMCNLSYPDPGAGKVGGGTRGATVVTPAGRGQGLQLQ
ncbi:MAG: hypothetical protein ACYCXN_03590 [Acidimicrobiales bacterium]